MHTHYELVYQLKNTDVNALHPKVNEVAVVGVCDERHAEVPKAFVVEDDDSLTIEELQVFARERMTGYKRP